MVTATQWGVEMAMPGPWQGAGRGIPFYYSRMWGLWSMPLYVPPAWAGTVPRTGTSHYRQWAFQKGKDPSQLGPRTVSKANRKRP